jgi:hypothetical protein
VSVTRRRGQTDIRGLVTAGRAVRQERFCWSNNDERGFEGGDPVLLLIVQTQVAPRAAASSSSWSGCFEGWVNETSGSRAGLGWARVVPRSRQFLPVRGRCQRGARAAQRA